MNDLVAKAQGPLGPVSKYFASAAGAQNVLGAGIQSSFGVVTFKGKVWTLNYRGNSKTLMRKDGDGTVGAIDVVIVKAPTHKSKTYYASGYTEGASATPDCFSNNGVTPDPSSRNLQNNVCATCKQNAWGSRVVQQGTQASKGKACSDNMRLAIVPLGDIDNMEYGGPMLLRVPPTSLQELAAYGSNLNKYSYPYNFVGTKISFDPAVPYPKFNFQALRLLSDDEVQKITALQDDEIVERILAEGGNGSVEAVAAEPAASIFEQPPAPAAAPPRPQPAPVVNPAPTPQVVAVAPTNGSKPNSAPSSEVFENMNTGSELEEELDSKLHDLLPR